VVLDDVKIGREAHVSRAIIDKSVTIAPGATVGLDHDLDRARGFTVTEGGVTVVPKGTRIEP
jgi:glucose-1-phosphate adenylyltransferase